MFNMIFREFQMAAPDTAGSTLVIAAIVVVVIVVLAIIFS